MRTKSRDVPKAGVVVYVTPPDRPLSLPKKLESYGSAGLDAIVSVGVLSVAAKVLEQVLVKTSAGVISPRNKNKLKLFKAIKAAAKILVDANREFEESL